MPKTTVGNCSANVSIPIFSSETHPEVTEDCDETGKKTKFDNRDIPPLCTRERCARFIPETPPETKK